MAENGEKLIQLLEKLLALSKRQDSFSKEITDLREEINALQRAIAYSNTPENAKSEPETEYIFEEKAETPKPIFEPSKPAAFESQKPSPIYEKPAYHFQKPSSTPKLKIDLEKFIGENLINKIGIAITVIGVAIGAKYSIDHQLISPLTRIIFGYLMGLGLVGIGFKLKHKYENYSAVLVSGAIAIMYFITYAAYSFYGLFPQTVAFLLMFVFTAFTVVAAISYNMQVIAHIGLVGAYAVPFLLSEGSGKVEILFSYMTIINIGILILAIKKYWKPLYFVSFALTWLIFILWYTNNYNEATHFRIALTFLPVFFATFYAVFLTYKLIKEEKFDEIDVIMVMANSFVFFGLGYAILSNHTRGSQLLGLFALCNAIVHFLVASVIYKKKLADKNLFFLLIGMVLIFITIAVPIQLDGNWVTLLWTLEAALLFWIGRTKAVSFYEKISYPLMLFAFLSLVQDWLTPDMHMSPSASFASIIPFFNINFLSSLIFIGAFSFINYINQNKQYTSALTSYHKLKNIISFSLPIVLLLAIYFSIRIEISYYFSHLYDSSSIQFNHGPDELPSVFNNSDLLSFSTIWILNYSLLFFALLSFVNIKKIKNANLGKINLGLNIVMVIIFLTQGLYEFSALRDSYLNQSTSDLYFHTAINIGIRYISFPFVALILVAIYKYLKQDFFKIDFVNTKIAFEIMLSVIILWVITSELIAWLDMIRFSQTYKLGLSILWGVYALVHIIIGIWKKKQHLRIGAIVLFSVTLIKLFFYDIAQLETIAKTVVFVSLGILLLIISFLYNKYKHLIADGTVENEN